MAVGNNVYPLWKQSIMTEGDTNNGLNLTGTNGTFCQLLNIASYTYSATHQFFSSLSGGLGTDQQCTTPTIVNGLFKCDNLTYTGIAAGTVSGLVLYRKNAGANTTWRLVLYEDTGVLGFPVVANGANIIVTWNASGVFQL
jgi:hypothetical protein